MRRFLDRLTFNVPDGGGGGAPPAADASAPPSSASAPPPAGTENPPAPSAGDAPPAGAGDPPAGGEFYRPQGIAEHLLGKDQNETMDKMAKALEGYRARDAQNGVPEKPDAYGEFSGEIPETIKPHLDTLKGDPLFGRVAAKALEMKVPVAAYQALTQEFLSVAHEMGMMEPIVDEKAEREALTPDTAKHLPEPEQQRAREQRMNDNYAFVDGMVSKGLAKEDAEFAKAMLGDSSKGHRFFEAMRKLAGGGDGGGPALGGTQPGGVDPKLEIQRRQALPENTWGDPKFDQRSYDQLQADLRRIFGE
ncbi:hypothetical protein ACFHWW_27355 [Ensifer sp. P24N7]|uniref:hypothetical protein n=1 Tax=Sinorhizobium sp. P24N7 TaxID=3348358 RepID=UPI0035F2EAD1